MGGGNGGLLVTTPSLSISVSLTVELAENGKEIASSGNGEGMNENFLYAALFCVSLSA